MPHPPILFKNIYHFREIQKKDVAKSVLEAKGFKNGRVVIVVKKMPGFRPSVLKLSTTAEPAEMLADGSTVIPITVSMLDELGNVKRLNDQSVRFAVEGEGRLLNTPEILENPKRIRWGTAAALIKTNLKAGEIKIIVMPLLAGTNTVKGDTLVMHTIPPVLPSIYDETDVSKPETHAAPNGPDGGDAERIDASQKKEQLKKVEEDQKRFQTNEHH